MTGKSSMIVCAFPLCKKGRKKTPKKFVPVRHQRFCSDYCRLANWKYERMKGIPTNRAIALRLNRIESRIGIESREKI